ncbi:hypothetical protein AB0J28_08265 [Streptosporangium canum]|uniref:hypothetical protein n=1 Tax=Streptosporangium canum TaxID=324952 RepID=UPI003419A75C
MVQELPPSSGRVRRWWVGITLLVVGSVCILASYIYSDFSWLSGVLIEVGATLLLFAPLMMIQRRIEQRVAAVQVSQQQIEDRQDRAASEISALTEEVAQTKREMRLTLDQLSDDVHERVNAARQRDRDRFSVVGSEPSAESVAEALYRATELKLIPEDGCRVHLPETDIYVRFSAAEYPGCAETELILEYINGAEVQTIYWSDGESTADALVELVEAVQGAGQYPGDAVFDVPRIFTDLRDLLEMVHQRAVGERSGRPLGRVIQFCAPQWVIADTGIVQVDGSYEIAASGIWGMGWYDHVKAKGWADPDSLFDALESARALYKNGRLAIKPPGWKELPPF